MNDFQRVDRPAVASTLVEVASLYRQLMLLMAGYFMLIIGPIVFYFCLWSTLFVTHNSNTMTYWVMPLIVGFVLIFIANIVLSIWLVIATARLGARVTDLGGVVSTIVAIIGGLITTIVFVVLAREHLKKHGYAVTLFKATPVSL